ncbi:uncharacterized protein METZ01_LOCUS270014 [marine metagenome]|uniref:Uncharacterized protein n=1 Tax=marine metagenome TaxID=408172 RepID=A0A382JYF4_9ZZZZ
MLIGALFIVAKTACQVFFEKKTLKIKEILQKFELSTNS